MAMAANCPLAGHWEGTAQFDNGVAWPIEINIGGDGMLGVTSFSSWMVDEAVSADRCDASALDFAFPADLGAAALHGEGGSLVGTIAGGDGVPGTLDLNRAPLPVEVTSEAVHLSPAGGALAGEILHPVGDAALPAMIILHGGGDSDREAHRALATFFARAGFAVLIYDKRGSGESAGNWRDIDFEDRADDVQALLADLAARSYVDPARLGIFAFSQGGWVASLLFGREDIALAFAVQVSAPLVSPAVADGVSSANVARRAGMDEAEVAEKMVLRDALLNVIRHSDSAAARVDYAESIDRVRSHPWFEADPYEPDPDSEFNTRWYRNVMDYDPLPDVAAADLPILWVYGDTDAESALGRNIELIERLRRERRRRFNILVSPAAGHGLYAPVDQLAHDSWPMQIQQGLWQTIARWIGQSLAETPVAQAR